MERPPAGQVGVTLRVPTPRQLGAGTPLVGGNGHHEWLAGRFSLVAVMLRAEFRGVARSGSCAGLVAFHTRHKLLLMAFDVAGQVRLGRIVAQGNGGTRGETHGAYGELLSFVLRRPATAGRLVNMILHAFGYVSGRLSARERGFFLSLVAAYVQGRVSVAPVIAVLRSWVRGQGVGYLLGQSVFTAVMATSVKP